MLTTVWVSTPTLAERWTGPRPRLLPPLADDFDLSSTPAPAGAPLVGLHASASHGADQRWLEPVVRGVLAADPDVTFEVVADHGQARRWRGDPRVRVIASQCWPDYRADTARRGRDLLLAPLLPSKANAARSEVKRIDAARCGASLLVSDTAVFGVSPAEAALGMVAPLDVQAWIAAVLLLTRDPDRRRALSNLNRERLVEARSAAKPLFESTEEAAFGDAWRLN